MASGDCIDIGSGTKTAPRGAPGSQVVNCDTFSGCSCCIVIILPQMFLQLRNCFQNKKVPTVLFPKQEWRHQIFNNNLYCVIARALNLSKGGQLRLHYICDKHLVKGIIQSKTLMVLHLKVITPLGSTTYILNLRATISFFRSDHTCGSPQMIFCRPQKI